MRTFILWIALSLSFWAEADVPEVSSLTLDQKLGQMMLVGFRGLQVSNDSVIIEDIKSRHIGSVILFDRDVVLRSRVRNVQSPGQLKALVHSLQKAAEIPLFVSVDQEGGLVQRLKTRHGFQGFPSHEKVAQTQNLLQAQETATRLAAELDSVGINLNFAPVVDVNTNKDNPVIGAIQRSFSEDPATVGRYAKAFVEGQRNSNVLSVLKHFPGHGSSKADSHLGFVDVSDTWHRSELIPYQMILGEGSQVGMVMTAHVYNRHIDEKYPATLSYKTIQGILRDEIGWDGVVITDDMNMGAITDHFGFEESVVKAIQAGADIILLGNNLVYDETAAARAIAALKKALRDGSLSMERIDESVGRILRLKKQTL